MFRLFPARWRSHVEMRGLLNYRLSCCVNTLLQIFSATWELAELLEKWEAAGVTGESQNIPLQLKRVLMVMRGDLPQAAPHRDFLLCLDRNNIRLNMQHDANEVFLFILNLVQQQMEDQALALQIQDLYKISVETCVQCSKCSSIQAQNTYLLGLPLHIKENDNSLEECMTSFFKHQELEGRNCCFCPSCGTKNPSRKSLKLRSLPRILCVHLERFRNVRGFTQKLDCSVKFPETFDLSEILTGAFSADFAQNNCKYTLYGVVVHSGSAGMGHYTAYVRHKVNMNWYYADDSHVQQVSWKNVMTTYGGHNRYSTAYMLMYRRHSEEGQQPELSG